MILYILHLISLYNNIHNTDEQKSFPGKGYDTVDSGGHYESKWWK